VNELMTPDAKRGMFVTAIYGVISPETHRLTYANAGHNLPALRRARTDAVGWMPMGGLALGGIPNLSLVEHTLDLEPGDALVLYTDGITETYSGDQDEFFGSPRLLAAIEATGGSTASALLAAIERAAADFAGDTPPHDDLTLLVLHRTGDATPSAT